MAAENNNIVSDINQESTLFQELKEEEAILLIDSSGSTQNYFRDAKYRINNDYCPTIFEKMIQVASTLGHARYRIIFWNSPSFNEGKFVRGVVALPFIVKPETIQAAFAAVASNARGGTCPPLGFQAIPQEWLRNEPVIYLFTDGQIGCSEISINENKRQLVQEIRKLNCRVNIIAVEGVERNFNNLEEVNNAAGGDIYQLIRENNLTGKISQFISYNPVGTKGDHTRFVQINKCKPPAGYLPYGEKYFSPLRVNEFAIYIADELRNNATESKQLEIAQKLSTTLEYLTRDKPRRQADDIIKYFSSLFTVDANLIRWILMDAIEKERGGQAGVFANYRSELKNLFQQADGLIKKDVCKALGFGMHGDNFVSYVIENRVLSGCYRLVDKTLNVHGQKYPRSGYENVPVFPMISEDSKLTELQEQCLRQWTRCIYGSFYRIHLTSDEIIYLVLGNMLKVCKSSDTSAEVKSAYRRLARVMLNKKRLNSMQTEFDRIFNGEAPLPNSGKIEDFETYLRNVSTKLGISSSPYKLWHEICSTLDPTLGMRQEKYCIKEMRNECIYEEVKEDKIPSGFSYDYTCIITTEDISSIGGFRILPHRSAVNSACSPVYLLSEEGKNSLLNSNHCVCPVCYANLNANSFEAVGPKINFELPVSYKSYESCFTEAPVAGYDSSQNNRQSNSSQNNRQSNSSQNNSIRNASGKAGTLVILKGVVGSGKSTYAQKIRDAVFARGGVCYVEGTDKYCKDGHHNKAAVSLAANSLMKIREEKNDDVVVVVDTCGEHTGSNNYNVFGVDFSGWTKEEIYPNLDKRNMRGYFAWSLRNVLMRKKPSANDNHYLNPETAGVQVCIDVHKKKSYALFARSKNEWQFSGATVENLEGLAEEYAKTIPEFQLTF